MVSTRVTLENIGQSLDTLHQHRQLIGSLQASDFGVLSIALVTLLILFFNDWALRASTLSKTIICASVWLQPLVTGTIALLMNKYTGVSGNWCWISFEEKTLLWALGHAWRLCIVATMLAIYIFVFVQVRRRLKKRRDALDSKRFNRHYSFQLGNINEDEVDRSYRDLVMRRTVDDTLGGPIKPYSSDTASTSKRCPGYDQTHHVLFVTLTMCTKWT